MDTFYIGAAEGTSWPLTVDQAEAAVRVRTPGAPTTRGRAAVSGKDYVWFNVEAGDAAVECLYTDQFSLTVNDCEPSQAAQVLAWFFGLLPAGTPTVALTETNPTPTPINIRAGQESIETALSRLAAS